MGKVSNINFGGNFIKYVPVKKYTNSMYANKNVSFVEMDLSNSRDVFAMDDIAIEFGDDSFANNIALSAKNIYKNYGKNPDGVRIFALTEQNRNFEKLQPDKILGLAQTSANGKDSIELSYLQVNPRFIYTITNTDYKRIGSTILDCLKAIYKRISLKAAYNVKPFYKKNDFKEISPVERRFVWEKS